jgi:hypothetical protein
MACQAPEASPTSSCDGLNSVMATFQYLQLLPGPLLRDCVSERSEGHVYGLVSSGVAFAALELAHCSIGAIMVVLLLTDGALKHGFRKCVDQEGTCSWELRLQLSRCSATRDRNTLMFSTEFMSCQPGARGG